MKKKLPLLFFTPVVLFFSLTNFSLAEGPAAAPGPGAAQAPATAPGQEARPNNPFSIRFKLKKPQNYKFTNKSFMLVNANIRSRTDYHENASKQIQPSPSGELGVLISRLAEVSARVSFYEGFNFDQDILIPSDKFIRSATHGVVKPMSVRLNVLICEDERCIAVPKTPHYNFYGQFVVDPNQTNTEINLGTVTPSFLANPMSSAACSSDIVAEGTVSYPAKPNGRYVLAAFREPRRTSSNRIDLNIAYFPVAIAPLQFQGNTANFRMTKPLEYIQRYIGYLDFRIFECNEQTDTPLSCATATSARMEYRNTMPLIAANHMGVYCGSQGVKLVQPGN